MKKTIGKRFLSAILSLALLVSLAACSSGGASSEQAGAAGSQTPSASQAGESDAPFSYPMEPVTLTLNQPPLGNRSSRLFAKRPRLLGAMEAENRRYPGMYRRGFRFN